MRTACLQALDVISEPPSVDEFATNIWFASHDRNEGNAVMATVLWEKFSIELSAQFSSGLVPLLSQDDTGLRVCAADALAKAMLHFKSPAQDVYACGS